MFKRLFDILLTSIAILVLFPIALIVALAVLVNMGRPVLFTQERPGLNGRPFKMYKFRSMLNESDLPEQGSADSVRLTKLGRFLRSFSLDELPEFWNVFRGDMSLVGPRPLLMEYLPLYTPEQARRHEVRPGITGWAQVKGRNLLTWDEKFGLDVWYVDNQSLPLDIKILMLTVIGVIRRDGISQQGEATMTRFKGSGS